MADNENRFEETAPETADISDVQSAPAKESSRAAYANSSVPPDDGEETESPEQSESPAGSELYDWTQSLVFAVVFIVLVFTFVARIIGVEGTSMIPTLEDKDRILISNLFYTPKEGDIIVLRKESFMEEPIVKRVIGVAGDSVSIDFIAHTVTVNGKLLTEDYVNAPIAVAGDVAFPVTVPEGCVFVLGDNRNGSTDSRFSYVGMIDTRCIMGKVLLRVYPFTHFGKVSMPSAG